MAKLALQLEIVNDSSRVAAFFATLKAQTFQDWHLYLLDNGSNAVDRVKLREMVEGSGLSYTFFRVHPGVGAAAGHNFLFARHDCEFVIPLVLGRELANDFLEKAVSLLETRHDVGVVDNVYRSEALRRVSQDGSFFDASVGDGYMHAEVVQRLRVFGYECEGIDNLMQKKQKYFVQNRYHARRRKDWLRKLQLRRQTHPKLAAGPSIPEYDIAVITVGHNDICDEGLRTLEAARKATSLRVGAVFVDNGSVKYRLNEFVHERMPDAHVLLREKNYGFGHSCNMGVREVKARYYFFLNPDTILHDEKIFDKMWTFMQTHPDAGVVAPKIFYFDGRLQETCRRYPAWYVPFVQRTGLKNTAFGKRYAAYLEMHDYDHAVTRTVDWAQGSALCFDAEVLHELGGYDPRFFMYFEDIDLCRRTWGIGKKVYYCPDISLKHAHGKESAKISGFMKNLVGNPMARAHIVSWLKYMLKWGLW